MNDVRESGERDYHVVITSSPIANGARVLKDDDTFAVFDRLGDVRSGEEQGIYHLGTRHLSRLELTLEGAPLLLLGSTVLPNNVLLAVDLTNPDFSAFDGSPAIPYGSVHVFRSKFLAEGTCYERLQIANYGSHSIDATLRIRFDSDFADIFEVRGTPRPKRGSIVSREVEASQTTVVYRGLDETLRATRIELAPVPDELRANEAVFRLRLEAKQQRPIYLWIACSEGALPEPRIAYETAFASRWEEAKAWTCDRCSIVTNSERFDGWLDRSQSDLRMMVTQTTEGPYPYAGVPWFSTAFGRDGLWSAIEALWLHPELAEGVLRYLAMHQATELDPGRDAEPGKILHERRDGEMAALGEVPFGRYYGSIDSTPLFLVLAAEYVTWTNDLALLEDIWPNLLAARMWMDRYGDVDGDGFLEYGRRSRDGLLQQGWKDSDDSVFHADGTLADGPIALCEVQGYAYQARRGLARLARLRGEVTLASELDAQADLLRERFDRAFWCDDLDTYALALDGAKLPCRVRSSNAGHCLYSGIALPKRVPRLAETLLSEDMFSGWGIRTLGASERRFNPMSYHNGSVWPHDNAIIAAGLAQYGEKAAACRVLEALFDASSFIELHRLPELFCGFRRHATDTPTLYPVACAPQAWVSGAPFLLLGAVLGLRVDGVAHRVTLEHARLPSFLNEITIHRLPVGAARVDLRLSRFGDDIGVTVLSKSGDVEIVSVK